MLLEDVHEDDDLMGIEKSHMEVLRWHLFQTRLQNPIEDHNTTEDAECLSSEHNCKRARVEDAPDTQ